jgi:hypothetical protein
LWAIISSFTPNRKVINNPKVLTKKLNTPPKSSRYLLRLKLVIMTIKPYEIEINGQFYSFPQSAIEPILAYLGMTTNPILAGHSQMKYIAPSRVPDALKRFYETLELEDSGLRPALHRQRLVL